jgi:hypothetical protein
MAAHREHGGRDEMDVLADSRCSRDRVDGWGRPKD